MPAEATEAEPLDFEDALRAQRDAWERKPLLRALYGAWYATLVDQLSPCSGKTVELGAGIGSFSEHHPAAIATDVRTTPWADTIADAEALPFADDSVANLVMTDVLHHLPRPARMFAEAQRVLLPGGRVIMVEPYCSPLSTVAYRLGHHERVDMHVDPLSDAAHSSTHPLDANIALPTLLFWRHAGRFRERFPGLEIVTRERFSWLVYPLSGGFGKRQLIPDALGRLLVPVESALKPIGRIAAFRCLVTLEKR